MKINLQKIHKILANDGYIPSFADLINYDNNIGEFDITYEHICINDCYSNGCPDIIFKCIPANSFFQYLLSSPVIDNEVFKHIKAYEFYIHNTKFNYQNDKNAYYHGAQGYDTDSYYDVCSIVSNNISEFIPLYNLNKNYINIVGDKIQNFIKDYEYFNNKYLQLFKKYGIFNYNIVLGKSEESSVGIIEYYALYNSYTIKINYNIIKNKTFLEYTTPKCSKIKSIPIEKITYQSLESILKSLNKSFRLTNINDCLNHKDNPVKPEYLNYTLSIIDAIQYQEHIAIADIIWECLPHNPSMKNFIHSNLASNEVTKISDQYFNS